MPCFLSQVSKKQGLGFGRAGPRDGHRVAAAYGRVQFLGSGQSARLATLGSERLSTAACGTVQFLGSGQPPPLSRVTGSDSLDASDGTVWALAHVMVPRLIADAANTLATSRTG
jgi:hypothetical protein